MINLTLTITLILVGKYLLDFILDALNAARFETSLPKNVEDVYDTDAYQKSVEYKKVNHRFDQIESTLGLAIMLAFLWLGGFAWADDWARSVSDNEVVIALLFFAILGIGSDLLSLPFAYYHTFVIEEKFGFNKQTPRLFWSDKLKGWLLAGVIGSALLWMVMALYKEFNQDFWWYAWVVIALFTLLMNLFYARFIVPLFNKQTPLETGSLRNKIEAFAKKVDFSLQNIYVIDGSKRSTKANAYFSGFGREKRITLYDTLIESLSEDEIVSVLAHEVGHYKKKHIIWQMLVSIITMGFTLFILSVCLKYSIFSEALGISEHSFHAGLVSFSLLYSPINLLMEIVGNLLSRKFEYQADFFAKNTSSGNDLVSALKKLSSMSLSNLTPHPAYVWFHYSHPPITARILKLKE